ncbi:hypothetical protein B9Z55_020113 [Caenorhabditis nigoni]|uniref:CX domain-containing protein n=1 Tax=Caenorhabditis nigoni TaxID=1611254 RepID=A0A2G5TLC0_9PELO|nr:hypothetical protein B9Z55_020113 [Caenorhabditis nigoni]
MNVSLISVLFFLVTSCEGYRRVHRIRYDSTQLRVYLFSDSNVTSTYFESQAQIYIIKHPTVPITFDNISYYWNGLFQKSEEAEKVCKYGLTELDVELFNARFSNGTNPAALFFECSKWDECCGTKCCNNITGFLVTYGIN